jgi:hypothetical protein
MVSAGANALLINDPPHPYLLKLCDEAGIIVLQSNSVEVLPNAILEQAKFQSLLEERMNRIYSTLHYHPSICGWLIGLDLEPNFANYISFTDLELLPGSSLFAGVNTGRKKIVRVSPGHTESIYYDVGPVLFGDDEKQQMRQVSILSQDLNNLRDAGGIFISEFADFKSGRNILFQQINLPHDKVYHCGLVKRDRSTRIAFRELQRGWFDQEIIEAVDSESKEAFLYPIFGFSLLLIIIIYTRSNHVFRVQLARVFNHPHGFYHDVKNKRFIQKMQTFILGFCAILVMALIASSLLYSQRFSIEFDFISALLFQNCYLHTILLTIVNNAWASILYMSILFLLSLFFVTIIFKLTTLIFGQNITFGQSIIYACWAGANFLLLSPLTIIFYKGLSYSLFAKLEIVVVLIFLFWTFSRLLIALRVAASSTVPRVFLCFVGIHLLLVLIIGTILQYQNSFIQYLGYLFNPKI